MKVPTLVIVPGQPKVSLLTDYWQYSLKKKWSFLVCFM